MAHICYVLRMDEKNDVPIDYNKGRLPFRAALVRALEEYDATLPPGSALILAASNLIAQATQGNANALREIADRLDGKPAQSVDIRSVNIHANARELTEAELDEIIARAEKKAGRKLDADQKAITIDQ